jgi:putative transposase
MMTCPHCESTATIERPDRTVLGYRRFRCRTCRRGFNERTGTLFNYLEYPTDIVCLVVFWRLRYKLSLRDLAWLTDKTLDYHATASWNSRVKKR